MGLEKNVVITNNLRTFTFYNRYFKVATHCSIKKETLYSNRNALIYIKIKLTNDFWINSSQLYPITKALAEDIDITY